MAYYDALIAKWPSVVGANTSAKLVNLRAEMVTGAAVPMIVPAFVVYNAIVPSEFSALTNANQTLVRDIIGQGTVDGTAGKTARSIMLQVFGAGTTTRANLTAIAAPYDAPQVPWLTANGYPMTLNENDLKAAGLI
jgi:hypothetical protein